MSRILLVHQPVDGGVGRHVLDLFEGLSERGHETILCGPAPPSGSAGTREAASAVAFRPLMMKRAVAPRADLAAVRGYTKILDAVRPDLVHAHSSKAGAVARLGKLIHRRVPVLYTPHGYAFAGHFDHELERVAYRGAERSLAPLTSAVVAVCHAEARLAAKVCSEDRIRVVHNGIDPPVDGPVDPIIGKLAARGRVVCTVTQLRPGKGVDTLIDSLPPVLNRHQDVQLAVVGDGPLRESLRQRAAERGVAEAVHFLGEQADPRGLLKGATAFVLPSLAESFPYVILEAMWAGLPVIASDVGGIAEAVAHGESGLLVAPGQVGELTRSLRQVLDDPEAAERLGKAARAKAAWEFTKERMVAGTAEVYDEVLASGRA